MRKLVASLALMLPLACTSKPCKLDADCGARKACVHDYLNGGTATVGRCASQCVSDTDCVLSGHPSQHCRPLASGPGALSVNDRAGRNDTVATPLSALNVCLEPDERVK